MSSKRSTTNMKKKNGKTQRSPLQKAGAAFVDHLGKAAVEKLKVRLGLNTETKYVDYATSVASTATLLALCNTFSTPIAQGLTDNTREGSSARVLAHEWQFAAQSATANSVVETSVRLIGVRWSPTVGSNTSTNYNDVLEDPTNILSLHTFDPSYGNKIIFDEIFHLGVTAVGAQQKYQPVRFTYSPNDFHTRWTTADTAGTLANSVGSVICWYIVSNGATAANFPTVFVYQRVTYVDN